MCNDKYWNISKNLLTRILDNNNNKMDIPAATNEKSKKICAIDKEAVHRICSGQVVVDLAIAVKELVENSLDSGATTIEIKLIDRGKTCISVIDNGSGVLEKDFEGLGLKHHTSKLKEFSDLLEVETFGFRGEALSSLCALSDLNIITKHINSQHAFDLKFDKNGILIDKKICARQQGTTVHVRNIFKNLPVRAKEFEKQIKKEFTRMIQVLYSYCLVSTGVKLSCTNILGNKLAKLIVSTSGSANVLDNIISIYGREAKESLIEIPLQTPDENILDEYNLTKEVFINFTWKFIVSSCNHTSGRSTPDRQFFYVNGRPCDPIKISKLINHIYHKYNNKQYPFIYLNIQIEKSYADINVTPDKRTILFTQEQIIHATIKSNLERAWNTFIVKIPQELCSKSSKRNTCDSPETSPPCKRPFVYKFNYNSKNVEKDNSIRENIKNKITKLKLKKKDEVEDNIKSDDALLELNEERSVKLYKVKNNEENTSISDKESVQEEIEIKTKLPDSEMTINLQIIKMKLNKFKETQKSKKQIENKVKYRTKLDSKSNEVEKELEKELNKESFEKMEVIGQFNLGFILTKLENDIFIIDQHASDEKFRFEKLSNEIKLKTQKLILPKALNLAALNETILIENQHIFEANGFTFDVKNEGDPGNRIHLTGMPVSYGWQFDQEDIEELIFLLREGGSDGSNTKNIPRPSRVRQMLASRACRGAVMIGKALNTIEMNRLIKQMSQMKNPWNCPHGRPTLRHLLSLTLLKQY